MKKNHSIILVPMIIITMILIGLLFTFSACKQIKGPAIKFKSMAYQFGEVDEGAEISHDFVFTNPGSETLIISQVKPTCGCTIAGDYTKEVKPGKKGKIPLVLHTKGFQGDVIKTIKVETNVPDAKEIAITLQGKVNVVLEVNPRDLWLGNTKKDSQEPISGKYSIISHINTPVKILEVNPDADNVKAEVIPVTDGKEYIIGVTIFPPFKQGMIAQRVVVTTDAERKKSFDLTYRYYCLPDIEINPQDVMVFKEQLKTNLVREIIINSNIDKPIKPYNVHINIKNVSTETQELSKGKRYKIILKFDREFVFVENVDVFLTFNVENSPEGAQYRIPVKQAGEW